MSRQYNYEYYHCCCGPIAYEDPEHWVQFFGGIADRIISDLQPKTVLDAGCAMGYLVAALRNRGVDAYGIDISNYAISKVREDIKPYCVVGSLLEPLPEELPKFYDLVITIEVLEHLYAEEGAKAIKNLCTLSDCVIFTSTPEDFTERTHLNVQQREYWASLFAAEGFLDDLNYRPTYITPYACCYRRSNGILRQIEDYERNIRIMELEKILNEQKWNKALEDKEQHIQNQNRMLQDSETRCAQAQTQFEAEKQANELNLCEISAEFAQKDQLLNEQNQMREEAETKLTQITADLNKKDQLLEELNKSLAQTRQELVNYKEHYLTAISQREDLKKQVAQLQSMYDAISNAVCWKATRPMRQTLDFVKRQFKRHQSTQLLCKGVKCLKEHGVNYTWHKVKNKLKHRQAFSRPPISYYTAEELEKQRHTSFPQDIKFSILVPLYNTPEQFLHEMIQSVLSQTYVNWELCLADGSDNSHSNVEHICKRYARKDNRIKYKRLKENLGISGNSNACIDMSTGDYIALLDHDDLLHPAALYENMKAICEKKGDFIYSDEASFNGAIANITFAHYKPDFSPDTLRSYNYICHLSVFSRKLLQKVGPFNSEYNGSQDYDLILRLTEKAQHIVHLPQILYYWRAHSNSTAQNVSAKAYCLEAAKKALKAHLQRIDLKGDVVNSRVPSTYKINYKLASNPLVSIIIPNKDHTDDLSKCINAILTRTTYKNYEIIIVENNSEHAETFAYYDSLRNNKIIRILKYNNAFNYSAINNFAVKSARGNQILLLNNDMEIISPSWIEEMLMFAQQKDVGAVGTMLYYPDNTIQHAGIIVGIGGVAGHSHKHFPRADVGYSSRLSIVQNLSAVTAACIMLRRDVWDAVNGFDEAFTVAFNDVDLCMRIRKAGYLIVWTPYAELYHYESKTRGYEDTPEKQKRFEGEVRRFKQRWAKELAAGDPYYNPNLTLKREDFSFKFQSNSISTNF